MLVFWFFFQETSKPLIGLKSSILKERKEEQIRQKTCVEQIINYNQLTVLSNPVPATKKKISLFPLCRWLHTYCKGSIYAAVSTSSRNKEQPCTEHRQRQNLGERGKPLFP